MSILVALAVISIFFSIFLTTRNVKLSANNAKLKKENTNLQYELGKVFAKDKEMEKDGLIENNLSNDRINLMKERFKETNEIKPMVKKATKEDVEAFYKSQIKEKSDIKARTQKNS